MRGLTFLAGAALLALDSCGVLAASSSGCGKTPTLKDSAANTMTVNSKSRQYYVKIPQNYDNAHPYKLIFTLHALGGNAGQVIQGTGGYLPWYGLPALDTNNSAIYVSPNGVNGGWGNAGGEDLTFIRELIKTVEADLCIDQAFRFSTGFSYGAAMSYALACSLGKEIRAVAALSGGTMSGCTGGTDAVAYYGQHGISDQVLPIAGARGMRDRYIRNNGCEAQTAKTVTAGSGTHVQTDYKCRDGYPVRWVEFDGPHTPQPTDKGASKTFSADNTWAFFSQFT